MPSSTSSFSRRVSSTAWPRIFVGAGLIFSLLVSSMELRLALRGFRPTVVDSEALWLQQRGRAGALGEKALILVGASRIQLDADLAVLRARTGLEPVQLAIDGSSFLPVFEGLASDPDVRGTVVVDFSDHLLTYRNESEASYQWQATYERSRRGPTLPDFATTERVLSQMLHQHLRSYADGTQPLTALRKRILTRGATQQYLITLPDRSRLADYSKVEMPRFYFERVMRNLGQPDLVRPGMTWDDLGRALDRHIAALEPESGSLEAYARATQALAAQARAIQARGGAVLFVMLPKSGLVRAIDDHRFPRRMFWDRFAAASGAATLHYEDVPAWKDLTCPDGSHLDFRQRAAFSAALADALKPDAGAR